MASKVNNGWQSATNRKGSMQCPIWRFKAYTGAILAEPTRDSQIASARLKTALRGLKTLSSIKGLAYFPTPLLAGLIDTLNAQPLPLWHIYQLSQDYRDRNGRYQAVQLTFLIAEIGWKMEWLQSGRAQLKPPLCLYNSDHFSVDPI